jgi:integrase/recombinase XerD
MSGKRGYEAVKRMQLRAEDRRGGQVPAQEDFTRDADSLAVAVDRFLDRCRMLQRTEKAVRSHWHGLKYFLRWAQERDILYPRQVTHSILQGYQRWLWRYRKANDKPLSVSSQRGRLSAVKTFFSWLCREHVIEANPASDLELPRSEKKLPIEALSIAQVETILSVPAIADPLGLRDRALLELFYSTAIRRTEMARVALADLNREKRILWVRRGKGRKDRVVPVGQRALTWVEKYIEDVRPLLLVDPDQKALFLTGYGEAFNEDVLGRQVGQYIRKAGIERENAGCHLLRHTCATHMLEGGADIRFIQQLLGHEKLETTAIYTEVNIDQLQQVHARTHPAESPRKPAQTPDNGPACPPSCPP